MKPQELRAKEKELKRVKRKARKFLRDAEALLKLIRADGKT